MVQKEKRAKLIQEVKEGRGPAVVLPNLLLAGVQDAGSDWVSFLFV